MRLPTNLAEVDLLQRMEDLAHALRARRDRTKGSGGHLNPPAPSRPLASTSLRTWSVSPVDSVASRNLPAGSTLVQRHAVLDRQVDRPCAPTADNPASRAASPCRASPSRRAPCCASYQARKVREARRDRGRSDAWASAGSACARWCSTGLRGGAVARRSPGCCGCPRAANSSLRSGRTCRRRPPARRARACRPGRCARAPSWRADSSAGRDRGARSAPQPPDPLHPRQDRPCRASKAHSVTGWPLCL